MGNNGRGWIRVIVEVALAITTVVLAFYSWQLAKQANEIAQQANELAKQANEIVYKSNLPSISATREFEWKEGKATETITVSNVGRAFGPSYEAELFAYIEINRSVGYEPIYLPLSGYYGYSYEQATGNSYGVILIASSEGNHSYLLQIVMDFGKVASEYQTDVSLSLMPILKVRYADFMGNVCYDYYKFVGQRLEYVESDEYFEIRESANRNYNLANLADVNLNITELDGVKLWEWYKNQILMH